MKKKTYKEDTNIAHWGLHPGDYHGIINPPVARASSIIFPSLQEYENKGRKFRYGRSGTPLTNQFEETIAKLEGGYAAVSAPSGLAAIANAILAFVKAGEHILVSDSLYGSTRDFCEGFLSCIGVKVEYYDPLIGKGIGKLIRKNTAAIYMESPGSATFEIIDVKAITAVAKKRKITTILDNSWATGLLFRPFEHGVDISVISATKYISGHSDIMLGVTVAASEKLYKQLRGVALNLGLCGGSEELYLALRGLRTMKIRLKQAEQNAMKVARWLHKHPKVKRVYHPALPGDSNHKLWKRDFKGSNGLLSILLKTGNRKSVQDFVNALELFPIASSWGGFESLLQPQYLKNQRRALPWKEEGALIRLHIGLEDPDDLIADLAQALKKIR